MTSATKTSAIVKTDREPTGQPREQRAGSREEAVLLRDDADEQQARDEDERRPDLAGR